MITNILWILSQMAFYASGFAVAFNGNVLYTYGGMRYPWAESSMMTGPNVSHDTRINRAYVKGWIDNGYFYTLGGRDNYVPQATFMRTNLNSFTTEQLAPMNHARISYCFGTFNTPKQVIVVGGYRPQPHLPSSHNQQTQLKSVELYDFNTNSWTFLPDFPFGTGITHCSAAAVGEYLYVIGGQTHHDDTTMNREYLGTVWRMHRVARVWEPVGAIAEPLGGLAAVAVGDEIVYTGGHSLLYGFNRDVYVYHTVSRNSRLLPTQIPIEGHDIDMVRSSNGQIVIAGGEIGPTPATDNKTNAMRIGVIQ